MDEKYNIMIHASVTEKELIQITQVCSSILFDLAQRDYNMLPEEHRIINEMSEYAAELAMYWDHKEENKHQPTTIT